VPVVIPAAGRDSTFPHAPKSLIGLAGRHLIDFQLEAIHKVGLDRVVVVRGHEGGQFDIAGYSSRGVTFCDNRRHQDTFDLFSIFQAEEYLDNGFALVYSDILFDPRLLEQLLDSNRDIVLAVDNSYRYHRHEIDKRLDLAISRQKRTLAHRSLHQTALIELARLGKDIPVDAADYEFIGMAAFSRRGAEILRDRYHQCSRNVRGRFHEASSFAGASLTDLLQDLIDHGVTVHGLEVHKGWLEVHNPKDIAVAERELLPFLAHDVARTKRS
jgi:phosphoenolpyruvate phosphomutase